MWKSLICICLTLVGTSSQQRVFDAFQFQQNDYKVIPERAQVDTYDKRYGKGSVVNFKYNRTTPAINITFMAFVDFGYDLQVVVQAYKFLSNEYRFFPLRFQINLCDGLELNAIGSSNYKNCGNFTGCPIKKNKTFFICNWTSDQSKLPPLVPNGRYKIETEGTWHGISIGKGHVLGTVVRPIAIPEK